MNGKTVRRLKKIATFQYDNLEEKVKKTIRFQRYWRRFKGFFHNLPWSERHKYFVNMFKSMGEGV